jgi:hypothetical protein
MCISPFVNMSCANIHYSLAVSRAGKPRKLDLHPILTRQINRGACHDGVRGISLTTSRQSAPRASRASGQMISGGHPTVPPTPVIAWKTRFLTETWPDYVYAKTQAIIALVPSCVRRLADLCFYGLRLAETVLIRLLSCGSSRLCHCYCPEINASGRDYYTVLWSKRCH